MSSSKQFPDAFASLLAGLLTGGKGTMLRVEPREGESLEDAIARTEAEHREVCQGCAEAYELEQFEAKKKAHDSAEKAARREAKAARKASRQETDGDAELNEARKAPDGDTDLAKEQRIKMYAHHEHEREMLAKKQKAEEEQFLKGQQAEQRYEGMRPELSAPYGAGENGVKRTPIGYMAFHVLPDGTARAIPPSFTESREEADEALARVASHPLTILLDLASESTTEIRPVFAE